MGKACRHTTWVHYLILLSWAVLILGYGLGDRLHGSTPRCGGEPVKTTYCSINSLVLDEIAGASI